MNDGDREKLEAIHKTLKIMVELLLDLRNNRYYSKKNYVPDRNLLFKADWNTWEPHDGVVKDE